MLKKRGGEHFKTYFTYSLPKLLLLSVYMSQEQGRYRGNASFLLKQQNWWCSKMWLLFTESSWIMLFLLSSFLKLLTALFLHCILNFCSRLFKFRRWDVDDGSQSSRSRLFKVLYRWQLDLIQLLEEDVSPLIQVSTSVLATASVLSILGLQSHILNSIIGVHICQRCYIHW